MSMIRHRKGGVFVNVCREEFLIHLKSFLLGSSFLHKFLIKFITKFHSDINHIVYSRFNFWRAIFHS